MSGLFYGNIEGGKIRFHERGLFDKYISGFDEFDPVEIEVRKWRDTRTKQQNRYYFGVVLKLISKDTGFTQDELHQIFKTKYLTYKREYKGKWYAFVRTTTTLDTKEFGEYLDKIIRFVAEEFGIEIPEAGEDVVL